MNLTDQSNLSKRESDNTDQIKNLTGNGFGFTGLFKPTLKRQDCLNDESVPITLNCHGNVLNYFCEFCDNTSIHGFKFLGERKRYLVEKIWWFTVVSLAIVGSGILIYNTHAKWVTAPVMVTFATTETPIWKIPFPAVTICPELKVDKKVLNYSDVLSRIMYNQTITEKEWKYFSFVKMVCDELVDEFLQDYPSNITDETIEDTDLHAYLDALVSISSFECKWMGKRHSCENLLSVTYTSDGKCQTFNALSPDEIYADPEQYNANNTQGKPSKNWSLEKGFPSDPNLDTYPFRTILAGSSAGFQIDLLIYKEDMDYGCKELQGFKVTLHHPAEEPDMDRHFRIPLDEAVFVSVKPRMMTTSNDIAPYSPHERRCYLPGEKTLRTFKIYTQHNCLMECLTNYTKKVCGCIGFHMAYFGSNTICTMKDKPCMEKAKVSFLKHDLNIVLNGVTHGNDEDIIEECDCLPACTSLEFDAETSQTKFDWMKTAKSILQEKEIIDQFEKLHYSRLIVYYKEMDFMTSERHELYGTIDFLANCGGLLGLFCGFSFTSLIEIVYYMTLRFICNLKKFGSKFWSGASE